MKRTIIILLVVSVCVPLVATGLRSGCTSARLRVAGRLMICRVRAYVVAFSSGREPDADLAACDASFETRWRTTTDTFGDCPAVDGQAILSEVRTCIDTVVNLIVGRRKTIFASSQLLTPGSPHFVYPEGADARCQQMANAVPAISGKQFRALMCGASPDVAGGTSLGVRERFSASLGGYVDRLGNPIADSLDDLLDGTISNLITIDETGTPIVVGGDREYAWTGCQGNGAPNSAAYLCQPSSYSWATGHVGTTGGKGYLLSASGGTFIDAELESCDAPLHLICVEQ